MTIPVEVGQNYIASIPWVKVVDPSPGRWCWRSCLNAPRPAFHSNFHAGPALLLCNLPESSKPTTTKRRMKKPRTTVSLNKPSSRSLLLYREARGSERRNDNQAPHWRPTGGPLEVHRRGDQTLILAQDASLPGRSQGWMSLDEFG